jgi:hypothetical protein
VAPNINWQSSLGFPWLVYVSASSPGTAGQFSHVQCFAQSFATNGTGWQVIIDRVVLSVTQSAVVRLGFRNASLTALDGVAGRLDFALFFNIRVEGRSQINSSILSMSVTLAEIFVPAGVPYVVHGPFRFGGNVGLTCVPLEAGVGLRMVAWVTQGQHRGNWP